MEESFQQAATAMLAFMCGPNYNKNTETGIKVEINMKAHDRETLLHDFMDEVLYMFSQCQVVVGYEEMRITCESSDTGESQEGGFVLKVIAMVIPYNRQQHVNGSEVKAVTWSNIRVGDTSPFDAYVVLDI